MKPAAPAKAPKAARTPPQDASLPPASPAPAPFADVFGAQVQQWQQLWQPFTAAAAGGATDRPPAAAAMPPTFDPARLQALQREYADALAALWNPPEGQAVPADRRFAGDAWARNPVASLAARAHALQVRMLAGMAEALQADPKTRARVRFAVEQWAAASAPSNFIAFNPDAVQAALDTQGQSLARGLQNMAQDLQRGYMRQTDEGEFEVGRNVATSEGAVVFENDYFQLLEYKPLTDEVHARPLLLVPPCINKFYILDLQPGNSLIRYAVEQGHRTFVMSWRNADASLAHATWDDYVEHGVLKAIDVVADIARAPQVNALGFCIGGTLLGTALAVMAARGEHKVASATFLTTFLDFSDTGVLDIFVDENLVRLREMQLGQGGVLPGRDLASTFSFLRPNELVWNYVVGNYLKGETPPPFDLLYWNSDATNLPGPFYAWYLRNTYLENRLVRPGAATVCGVPIDLSTIDLPVYIYGSRDDHIVPVGADGGGAYATTQLLPGPKRFVMGASGHIAGVINPPAKKKRSHWVRPDGALPPTLGEWLAGAEELPGSWWTDWSGWLAGHAGRMVAAPRAYGNAQYPPIEPAPGRYVQQKA